MLEPGDICQYNCAEMVITVVREIKEDDPYFKELLEKWKKYYDHDFFDVTPLREGPFYVVNFHGDEEIADYNDLFKIE